MQRTWKTKTQKIKMRCNLAKLNYLVIILVYALPAMYGYQHWPNKI